MAAPVQRINVSLDAEHAQKLSLLADRTHVQEGTLARSLLCTALDHADGDPASIVELLDGISGALDRAITGRVQAVEGKTIALEDL